jgi:uncharacterized protein
MLYDQTVPPFTKTLGSLLSILDKAAAHADAKKFDVGVLLTSRLAPDQFHLIKQVQIVCDTAKLCTSRLTGKDAPVHEDKEQTLSDVKKRIQDVMTYLRSFSAKDFNEAASRTITQPRWEGKTLTATDYVLHHAVPNFYFHVTTAYAILRHNGVDIGKKDYLGELPFQKK